MACFPWTGYDLDNPHAIPLESDSGPFVGSQRYGQWAVGIEQYKHRHNRATEERLRRCNGNTREGLAWLYRLLSYSYL